MRWGGRKRESEGGSGARTSRGQSSRWMLLMHSRLRLYYWSEESRRKSLLLLLSRLSLLPVARLSFNSHVRTNGDY
jgi:hypothetical protein